MTTDLEQAMRHPDVIRNALKKGGPISSDSYSPSNPPPYPVTSVNGQTGDVVISSGLTFDDIYPVGSIYMSVNSTNPGTLFGGTWEQIEDTFLLAAGTNYTAGATGGEATHTLQVSEIPSHNHAQSSVSTQRAISTTTSGATNYIERGSGVYYTNTLNNFTTGSKGGGGAHNNMPPYIVVYMWKRTA